MKSADEEIAVKVTAKLQEDGKWSKDLIGKFDRFIKDDGKVSSTDIIFLIKNQRKDNLEGKK